MIYVVLVSSVAEPISCKDKTFESAKLVVISNDKNITIHNKGVL